MKAEAAELMPHRRLTTPSSRPAFRHKPARGMRRKKDAQAEERLTGIPRGDGDGAEARFWGQVFDKY